MGGQLNTGSSRHDCPASRMHVEQVVSRESKLEIAYG